jgi:hypothetical protein
MPTLCLCDHPGAGRMTPNNSEVDRAEPVFTETGSADSLRAVRYVASRLPGFATPDRARRADLGCPHGAAGWRSVTSCVLR